MKNTVHPSFSELPTENHKHTIRNNKFYIFQYSKKCPSCNFGIFHFYNITWNISNSKHNFNHSGFSRKYYLTMLCTYWCTKITLLLPTNLTVITFWTWVQIALIFYQRSHLVNIKKTSNLFENTRFAVGESSFLQIRNSWNKNNFCVQQFTYRCVSVGVWQ